MGVRVPYDKLKQDVKQIFLNLGLTEEKAEICTAVHIQSSADGVESHGLNRIPRFVEYVQKDGLTLKASLSLQVQRAQWKIMTDNWGLALPMRSFVLTEL